jgi:hypothetical protein
MMIGLNGAVAEPTQQELEVEAQALAAEFQANLKSALISGMSAGGPLKAIPVCRSDAPKISEQLSAGAWTVARTALKVRNPNNAPNAWQREQMEAMIQGLAAGEKPADLVVSEIRSEDQGSSFYYMQPIMTGKLCLACHGSQLDPDVQKALNKNYPQDKAVGFSEGELRGAFTFSKKLYSQ